MVRMNYKASWVEYSQVWNRYECYVEADKLASDDDVLELAQQSDKKVMVFETSEYHGYQHEDVEEVKK
jgi:hypothetical protein